MTTYSRRLVMNRMRPLRHAGSSIKREGLLARLKQHKDTHLITIHAPAGFGKTVLLTQYHEWLKSQLKPCSWLTLDDTDDDPVQLLAYLIASLDSTDFIPGDILESALDGFHGFEEKDAFNLTVNCMTGFKTPVYIFLDDYHLICAGNTQQLIRKLIELTLDNTRFIIASREFPTSLKGRIQISGSFFELTAFDLALTQAETRYFLSLSKQNNITDEFVSLLYEKTEGWAAAIEFTRTWLEKDTEIELAGLLHQSTDFTLFIMTEIFNRLPERLRDVMVKTSIINQFDDEIINAVCELTDGWRVLEELFQYDLIIPVDETGACYRYHYLLAEFLQDRFHKKGSFEKQTLYKLASECYLAAGNATEALKYAISSNAPEFIASVIERSGGWHFVLDGRIATFVSTLDHLPLETIQHYPSTYLGYIMLTAKAGNVTEALEKYSEFQENTLNFTVLDGKPLPSSFTVEAKTIDFFLGALEDRPQTPQYLSRIETVLEGLAKEEHFLRASLLNYLSYGYFDSVNFEKAYKAGEEAIFHRKELRSIYGENYLYFHLGKICLAQGRLRDAEQLYHEGFQLAVDNFGIDSDMAAIASAHLAESLYEKNEIKQAQAYLENAFPRIEQTEAWFDVYISAYFTAAKIACIPGKSNGAGKILLKASYTGKRRNIQRLRLLAVNQYIRLMIKKGRLLKANWMIKRLQFEKLIQNTTGKEFANYRIREEAGLTTSYYLIESGNAYDAIKIMNNLSITARRNNCRRSLISLYILIALAYFRLGKHKQALTKLNEAVSHAIFEGFKRPFLEYGNAQQQMLELALSNHQLFPINRLKRSFLVELINIISQENKARDNYSPDLLTPREKEVVKYVYEGCSNKEIARYCDCSENTVKFHLKNIFSKLGVKDRKTLARITWEYQL